MLKRGDCLGSVLPTEQKLKEDSLWGTVSTQREPGRLPSGWRRQACDHVAVFQWVSTPWGLSSATAIRGKLCLSALPLGPWLLLPVHSLLGWLGLSVVSLCPGGPVPLACPPPPPTGSCCGPGHRERLPESSAQHPTVPFPEGSLPWQGGAEAAGAEWGLLFPGSHREGAEPLPPMPATPTSPWWGQLGPDAGL